MMVRLALADIRYEAKMFLCHAIALCAVLAPLMVLYGLKFGVVNALTAELLERPANREILVIGNRSYPSAWLEALAARPEVGFLAPRTRSIAATLYFAPAGEGQGGLQLAELVPTAPGDPLLDPQRPPLDDGSVALSESLAVALRVGVGDAVRASAIRQVGDDRQRVDLPLRVAEIVPPETGVQRKTAFVTVPVLEAVEDYRDGLAVPRYGWDGRPPPEGPRSYASFRLYAADLDGVVALTEWLSARGIETRSALGEIEAVRRLDRSLTQVFAIIAALGGVGYLLSLGANLWSNVERKQRELSIIRLLGLSSGAMMRFPVVQAIAISVAGLTLAFAVYFGAQRAINALFAVPRLEGQPICMLLPEHYATAAAATLISAVLAAAVAGWQASRIEPAEGMRDV